MKLIVGLGNIGSEYAKTNHNAGFMVVDALAEKYGFTFKNRGCDADYGEYKNTVDKGLKILSFKADRAKADLSREGGFRHNLSI